MVLTWLLGGTCETSAFNDSIKYLWKNLSCLIVNITDTWPCTFHYWHSCIFIVMHYQSVKPPSNNINKLFTWTFLFISQPLRVVAGDCTLVVVVPHFVLWRKLLLGTNIWLVDSLLEHMSFVSTRTNTYKL